MVESVFLASCRSLSSSSARLRWSSLGHSLSPRACVFWLAGVRRLLVLSFPCVRMVANRVEGSAAHTLPIFCDLLAPPPSPFTTYVIEQETCGRRFAAFAPASPLSLSVRLLQPVPFPFVFLSQRARYWCRGHDRGSPCRSRDFDPSAGASLCDIFLAPCQWIPSLSPALLVFRARGGSLGSQAHFFLMARRFPSAPPPGPGVRTL